jgi:L-ascorbate metabolism protein UlaG (beta-lactamase superfamily)
LTTWTFQLADSNPNLALAAGRSEVTLKWLGNTGWSIELPGTTILVDPFFSRKQQGLTEVWETDEKAVEEGMRRANLSSVDYILVGHSHIDHVGDVAFIAQKYGSQVIGSERTGHIVIRGGVPPSEVRTVKGGELLQLRNFTLHVIESRHKLKKGGNCREKRQPSTAIYGGDFRDPGTLLYNFNFDGRRILHQSTENFLEGQLTNESTDLALLATGGQCGYSLERVLGMLRPKAVIVHHFDEWREPYATGIKASNLARACGFSRDIKKINSGIKVVIPTYFEPYQLDKLIRHK